MSIFKCFFNRKTKKIINTERKIEFERFDDDNSFSFASELSSDNTNYTDSNMSSFESTFLQAEKEKLDGILADAKRKKALDIANIKDSTRKGYKYAFNRFERDGLDAYIQKNNARGSIGKLTSSLKNIDAEKYKNEIEALNKAKHKKRYRVAKYTDINLRTIQQSIAQIKNEKMKNGFKMMLNTGIRVATLGGLEKRDITLQDGKVFVKVRFDNNKTCKEITIIAIEDEDMYKYLENRLNNLKDNDKVFYAAKTYQNKACKLKLTSHLLRAANVQIKLYTYSEDIKTVKEQLGHSECTNTERFYIKSKNINFYGTRFNDFKKKLKKKR